MQPNVHDPLESASTIAVLVHGVGDHSQRNILKSAQRAASQMPDWMCEVIEVEDLVGLELEENDASVQALQIRKDDKTHIVIPVVWSRLRLRAAKERDLDFGSVSSRWQKFTLEAFFKLLITMWNFLRCVPATQGVGRKGLIVIATGIFAIFASAITLGGFQLGAHLIFWRLHADKAGWAWWRFPALILMIVGITWALKKLLIVCDFVGDVAAYVGSSKHRRKAEARFREFLSHVAARGKSSQIIVIGHSLGTVMTANAISEESSLSEIGPRLFLVTMGSPLGLMHWFFPRVRGAEELLNQFESRNLIQSWINLWRDADWIGRALKLPATTRFSEKSVGDGMHPDYWGDPRCWVAVISYLRASAEGSVARLLSEWSPNTMSNEDESELMRRARLASVYALTFNIAVAAGPVFFWSRIREQHWLSALDFWPRWSILILTGIVTVLAAIYYFFASKRVGGDGASRRQMLARYRLYWSIAIACVTPASVLSVIAGFVWWMFFLPYKGR